MSNNKKDIIMEDNTMTEADWNNIDLDSRTLFKEFLKRIGATDIEDTHGNCCIDLLFTIKGKRVAVELKRRSFSHSKFGDVFGEAIKLECSQRRKQNGQFQKVWIVNDFTDNVIAIADLEDKRAKHFQRWCPETSLVKGASHEYIQKECLSLPQTAKFKYTAVDGKLKFTKIF